VRTILTAPSRNNLTYLLTYLQCATAKIDGPRGSYGLPGGPADTVAVREFVNIYLRNKCFYSFVVSVCVN